jgi:hypothetical protein
MTQNELRNLNEKYKVGQLMRLIVNDVAKLNFIDWESAYRIHRDYVRKDLVLGNESPKNFVENMRRLNKFLQYFPVRDPLQPVKFVSEQELIETLTKGVKFEWVITLLSQNRRHDDFDTLDEARDMYFRLYQADQMRARLEAVTGKNDNNKPSDNKNKRKKRSGEKNGNQAGSNKKQKFPCKNCGKIGHKSDDCWTLEKNADKRPKNYKNPKNGKKQPQLTQEQLNTMLAELLKKNSGELKKPDKPKKKRPVSWNDEDEEENNKKNAAADNFLTRIQEQLKHSSINDESSEEEFESYMLSNSVLNLYPFFSTQPPKKKQKLSHYSAEIVVEIQDRNGENVPIRALLDTGTSSTLLLRDFVAKGRAKGFEHQPTKWATLGGNFVTNRKALVEFKFPELSISKTVTWIVHVDKKTSREMAAYDMIIGMDLMTAIGIRQYA